MDNNLYEQILAAMVYVHIARPSTSDRRSFIWKGQHFEIDTFLEPVNDLVILQSKGVAEEESVKFPPFIRVIEDVTGNQSLLQLQYRPTEILNFTDVAYLSKKTSKKFSSVGGNITNFAFGLTLIFRT